MGDIVHFTDVFYALVSSTTPPTELPLNAKLLTVTTEGNVPVSWEASRLYANVSTPRLDCLPQFLVKVLRGLSRPLPRVLSALRSEMRSGLKSIALEDGALVLEFWHANQALKQEFSSKRQRKKWAKLLLTDYVSKTERLGVEVTLSQTRRNPEVKPDIAALMDLMTSIRDSTSRQLDEVTEGMKKDQEEMRKHNSAMERRVEEMSARIDGLGRPVAPGDIHRILEEEAQRHMEITNFHTGANRQQAKDRIQMKNPQANLQGQVSGSSMAHGPARSGADLPAQPPHRSAQQPRHSVATEMPGPAHARSQHSNPEAVPPPGSRAVETSEKTGHQSAQARQEAHHGFEEEEIGNDGQVPSGSHSNVASPAAPAALKHGSVTASARVPAKPPSNSRFEKEKVQEAVPKGEMIRLLEANGIGGTTSAGLAHLVARRQAKAVDLASVEEQPSPRAPTFDTLLVLDASASMAGPAFQEMQQLALSYVNSVEDTVTNHSLEENIAIIAINQGTAVVKQHLTNDYQRVYDAIENLRPEGATPFLETFLVCLAAIQGRGGIIKVGGVHKVKPRIIFMTDGKPSDEVQHSLDGPDEPIKNPQARMVLITSLTQFKPSRDGTLPNIQWVPVGAATDPSSGEFQFLEALSKMGLGEVVQPQDRGKLSKYCRIQDAIGKLHQIGRKGGMDNILHCIDAIYPDLDSADKDMIVAALEDKNANPEAEDSDGEADNFDQIHIQPELPPPGTRVMRGPDWKWGNQDSGGCGTVLNHKKHHRVLWVEWDNGSQNVYRCGAEDAYDVLPADFPRTLGPAEPLQVGVQVVRGPDWNSDQEDGGKGNKGVIIRKRANGSVKVRWENGFINAYKYEPNGTREILIVGRDEGAIAHRPQEYGEDEISNSPVEPIPGSGPSEEGGHRGSGRFGWAVREQDGTLVAYPSGEIIKLEETFKRRPQGSCVVRRDGSNRRVLFKTMLERDNDDTGTNLNVKRLDVDSPDFVKAVATRDG